MMQCTHHFQGKKMIAFKFNDASSSYSLTGNALNSILYADRFGFNALAGFGLVSGTVDIRAAEFAIPLKQP
jgi:hypothetical protein